MTTSRLPTSSFRLVLAVVLVIAWLLAGSCDGDDPDDDDVTDDDASDDDATGDDDDDAADDDTADDDDTAGTVEQSPITFTVTNGTDAERYFDYLEWWTEDLNDILGCAADTGSGWQSCLFGLPFDTDECTPEIEGQDCQGGIDAGPAVYVLPAGGSLDISWPGTVWRGDPDHCSAGVCYREGSPYEGQYGATVVVFDESVCIQGSCKDPGPDGGVVWGAGVTGNRTSHYVEFDIPSEGETLEIEIQ